MQRALSKSSRNSPSRPLQSPLLQSPGCMQGHDGHMRTSSVRSSTVCPSAIWYTSAFMASSSSSTRAPTAHGGPGVHDLTSLHLHVLA